MLSFSTPSLPRDIEAEARRIVVLHQETIGVALGGTLVFVLLGGRFKYVVDRG